MEMETKQSKLEPLHELLEFVRTLENTSEEQWTEPIAEGKWAPRDIISHMMLWDKYFLEHAIRPIAENQPLNLLKLDFDKFNRDAAGYGLTQEKQQLLEQTDYYRKQLLDQLKMIPIENYGTIYSSGNGNLSVDEYLADFIEHDRHHMNQIRNYIESP